MGGWWLWNCVAFSLTPLSRGKFGTLHVRPIVVVLTFVLSVDKNVGFEYQCCPVTVNSASNQLVWSFLKYFENDYSCVFTVL